jgi:hypothetical protein
MAQLIIGRKGNSLGWQELKDLIRKWKHEALALITEALNGGLIGKGILGGFMKVIGD